MSQPINFVRLAAELLERIDQLLPAWLPGGHRNGPEYECADLSGGKGTSCKVNVNTGKWADFATEDQGGDLISLYAAIHGVNNGKAARMLMDDLGWSEPKQPRPAPVQRQARVEPPPADQNAGAKPKPKSVWEPIVPVPDHAPVPDLVHFQRGKPEASWAYRLDGKLYGHVARYPTSDGGKEIVPWTYCRDTGDPRGLCHWHMKQWPEGQRPLYLPWGGVIDPARPVLVVEGEKCALAAHQLLAGTPWQVISWPGGGNAWEKADWAMLQSCQVTCWPDADAKREKLTKAERDAGVDPASKPIMPLARQPGLKAMRAIAAHLQAQGCVVRITALKEPGVMPDGWDVADDIGAGMDEAQALAYIDAAAPVGQDADAPAEADQPLPPAGAGPRGKRPEWQGHLVWTEKGAVKACRENVVIALDGVPTRKVPGIPDVAGVVAFNEFTNNVCKLKGTPWGTRGGEWLEEDELEMGAWLVREHGLPSMPRAALEEAVKMTAGRHRYHPVRDYLATVRGTWDKTPRLGGWLQQVCQVEMPADPTEASNLRGYLRRVGSWLVMAMCARVLTPGVKFDYMVIFEGRQGWGKSTLSQILGGEWFADTGLVMGEKDAYQNLQGVWVYEIGELDSFSKTEVTKVKAFASSQKDRFRASFDRRPRDYPRQVVFIGTTNEDHYLTDLTGNRRFWPVRLGGPVDLAWVRTNRDQLFAEAMHALDQGHRFNPTFDEQRELFDPQQRERVVESPIESRIKAFLYDEDQDVPHGKANGAFVNEITTAELLARIGIGIEKQVTSPTVVKAANAVLKNLGWKLGKSSAKGGAERVNVFKRPQLSAQPAQVQGHQQAGATDACHV
jgi:putative DNA primase/helicase